MRGRKIGKVPELTAPYGFYPYQRDACAALADGLTLAPLTRRMGKPVAIGVDLSSKPDQTGFAIHTPDGIMTVVHGRRLDHEALCCAAIRARRAAEGKPPAQWVVVAYRQKLRILRHAKQLAQRRRSALSTPARDEGQPSTT